MFEPGPWFERRSGFDQSPGSTNPPQFHSQVLLYVEVSDDDRKICTAMKGLSQIIVVVQCVLLVAPVLSSTSNPENMDSEKEIFHKQVLDIIKKTVGETIRVKVGAMAARQAEFEDTFSKTLASLRDQILNRSQTISSSANVENLSFSGLASPQGSPPQRALPCNICERTFSTHSELDFHVQCHHRSLTCNHCGKVLRSQPDLNLHHHRYHAGTKQTSEGLLTPQSHQPSHYEPV